MIKFLGKNKFENTHIIHRFKNDETYDTLKKLYGNFFSNVPCEVYDGACVVLENVSQNFYVVKPLDTPESIAKKLNVSKQTLIKKNQIKKLFVGQILKY